ncbi:putative ribosomal N-acetyltransferase YdaF [compost metagenome]
MEELILKTERLIIRPASDQDIKDVHQLQSLPEITQFNTADIPKTIQETEAVLSAWISDPKNLVFAMETVDGSEFIGLIGIKLGREKYRNAEIWFKTHSRFWKQGLTTEAVKRIIRFGFEDLNLHRIEAGCAIGNTGSIRVLEKAGMFREGHTRQVLPLQTGWSDGYDYAILDSDKWS